MKKLFSFIILTLCTLMSSSAWASGPNFNDSTRKAAVKDAAGNIGVGTTAPVVGVQVGSGSPSWTVPMTSQTDAYVTGDVEIDGALYVDGFIYGNGSRITGIPSAAGLSVNSIPKSFGGTFVDSLIYADANGNLGINTSIPAQKLDINGTVKLRGPVTNYSGTDLNLNVQGNQFHVSGSNGTVLTAFAGSTALPALRIDPSQDGQVGLQIDARASQTADLQQWRSGGDTVLAAVTANGNLGIGLNNPGAKFVVDGTMYTLNGNVGVGTSAPGTVLQVQGLDIAGKGVLYVKGASHGFVGIDGTAVSDVGIYLNSAGSTKWYIYRPASSNDLRFYSTADHVTFQEDGNVGFGTVTPAVGLQLGAGAPSWTVPMTSQTDAYVTGDVEIDGALYVDGFIYGNGSRLTGLTAGATANSAAGSVPVSTGSAFVDSTIYASAVNVGVGTTDPKFALHLYNTALSELTIDAPAANQSRLTWSKDGSRKWTMYSPTSSDTLAIYELHSGKLGTRMAFSSGGNVGVGASDPAAKLQVDGALYISNGTAMPTWSAVSLGAAGDAMFAGDVEIDGALYVDGFIYGNGSKLSGISSSQWSNGASSAVYYNSGNVGVGTSAPRSLFSVEGIVYATTNIGVGTWLPEERLVVDQGKIKIRSGSSTGTISVGPNLTLAGSVGIQLDSSTILLNGGYFRLNDDKELIVGTDQDYSIGYNSGSDNFEIVDGAAVGSNQRLVIDPNGNIGVGVTNPGGKLVVDGTIYIPRANAGNLGIGTMTPAVGLQLGSGTPSWTVPMTAQNDAYVAGDMEIDGALYVDGFIYGNGSKLSGVTGTIAGLGVGMLPVATSATTIGDSVVTQTSSDIYVGSGAATYASADEDFFVNGAISTDRTIYSLGSAANYFAGNVGLGTTTPSGKLHIYGANVSISLDGAATAFNAMGFKEGGVSKAYMQYAGSGYATTSRAGSLEIETAAGVPIVFRPAVSEAMRITTTGNVGIGVNNPGAKLVVDGTVYIPNAGNIGVGTALPKVGLQVGSGSPSWTVPMTAQTDAYVAGDVEIDGALYVDGFIYGNGSRLTGITASAGGSSTQVQYNNGTGLAGSSTFVFDGNNVGIGSSSPASRLTVAHNPPNNWGHVLSVENTGTTEFDKNVALFIGNAGSTVVSKNTNVGLWQKNSTVNNYGLVNFYNSGGFESAFFGAKFKAHGTGVGGQLADFVIATANDDNPTVKMTVTSGGNLGVGVAEPGAKLVVDGTIYLPGTGNVGVGTSSPAVGLQVGSGSPSWTAPMTAQADAYVAGDVEIDGALYVDGFIYGNGSKLTGLPAGSSQWSDGDNSSIYYSSGNVGIGSSSPVQALDVDGGIYTRGNIGIGTASPGHPLELMTDGISVLGVYDTSRNLQGQIWVNGSGTTARQFVINMPGASGANGAMDNFVSMRFNHMSDKIFFGASPTNAWIQSPRPFYFRVGDNDATAAPHMVIDTSGNLGVGVTAPTAKLVVDGAMYTLNGNVGVGLSAPSALLHVRQGTTLAKIESTTSNAVTELRLIGDAQGAVGYGKLTFWAANSVERGGIYAYRDATTGSYMTFLTSSGAGSAFERMRLTNTGNVGIGIRGPTQKLAVDGTIYIPANDGNIGIGTPLPAVGLQLGAGSPSWTVPITSQADAYVTGDVEIDGALYVDGYIYGNGSRLTGISSLQSGASPTVTTAGTVAVDTTDDQLVFYGTARRVLSYKQQKSLTIESPTDADNILLWKAADPITITKIYCIVDPADAAESVVIDLQERDATADNPATVDTTITCDNDGAEDDGALSNAAIDGNDWLSLDIGAVTGTVSSLSVTIYYVYDAE